VFAKSPKFQNDSIEFHVTGLEILFLLLLHLLLHHHHHHHHYHHRQFPVLLSVVFSVCLRNFFVHPLTCTGLSPFLRCVSQFQASSRIRVCSIHSASLHFYFWSSKLRRSYYSSASYFYPTTFTALFIHNYNSCRRTDNTLLSRSSSNVSCTWKMFCWVV
jgi:hypothetical protein